MVKKIILSTILCALVLSHPTQAVLIDRVLAIVNSEPIIRSDVENFRKTYSLRKELDPFLGFVEPAPTANDSESRIINYLVQERLISQMFKASDQEVEAKIVEVMRSNSLDRSALENFLMSRGFKYDDYYSLMKSSIEKQQFLNREIRERVNISDEDVRNHYFNSGKVSKDETLEYSVQLIFVDESNYKSSRYALEAANTALKSVLSGESFAEVARRSSDDSSAKQGGEIGYVSSENLNPALLKAIRGMKIGAVSPVIGVSAGYYILKLLDIRSGQSDKIESQKNRIREELAKTEYARQLGLWTERTKQSAYIRINK
jgi:peptidyl-prolyl cis-trans isomerase SurA